LGRMQAYSGQCKHIRFDVSLCSPFLTDPPTPPRPCVLQEHFIQTLGACTPRPPPPPPRR
jgi:hypothetical protein